MISFKVDDLKKMHAELKEFTDYLRLESVSDDDIFASKLVCCELITNVIRHGGDEAEFTGYVTGSEINITVSAESLRGLNFAGVMPDVFAESGRGLYIVKSICCNLESCGGAVKVKIKRH